MFKLSHAKCLWGKHLITENNNHTACYEACLPFVTFYIDLLSDRFSWL